MEVLFFLKTLRVIAGKRNNMGLSSSSMLITFTILLTTKVKWIKLGPAFSIASSWNRCQVQQIGRGENPADQYCAKAFTSKCLCVHECVYVGVFFLFKKKKKHEPPGIKRWAGAKWRHPLWWVLCQPAIPFLSHDANGHGAHVPAHCAPSIISRLPKWTDPKWCTMHGSPVLYSMWLFIQLELLGHIKGALVLQHWCV